MQKVETHEENIIPSNAAINKAKQDYPNKTDAEKYRLAQPKS